MSIKKYFFLVLVVSQNLISSISGAQATSDVGSGEETNGLRDVLLVGNTVSGTVNILDGTTFQNLGSINVIPDLEERLKKIKSSLIDRIAYEQIKKASALKHFEPAEGQRYVDDVFVTPDGSKLIVSRDQLADVAAFDLTKVGTPLLWRAPVDCHKADHAAISPDGTQLVVSNTVCAKAQIFSTAGGKLLGSFKTGKYPHQNDYSEDGKYIYNSSIGDVGLPYSQNSNKGDRLLTIADARTYKVLKSFAFDAGIRPAVFQDNGNTMYAQLSYLNGLVKFDLISGKIVGSLKVPKSSYGLSNYPTEDDYPHNSAHHGLAVSGDRMKLCDVGTIDNTVSIVSTSGLKVEGTVEVGKLPYWATTSRDGKNCFVSISGEGLISVIDYNTHREIARTQVGLFPQRSRLGTLPESAISNIQRTGVSD